MNETPRAKKSLGQHFLKDTRISARIVELLRIAPEDRILEIGPGPGALTDLVHAKNPAVFRLIEKDSHWAEHHAMMERTAPKVDVLNADALEFQWESLEGPWKIISNLPYNVGSPLIWDIVSRTPELVRAVFMVQKEVADRMQTGPGNKDYGALSLAVQYYADPYIVANVPPNCFMPRPKVGSAVIRLTCHQEKPVQVQDEKLMFNIIRASFNQRRKTLVNGLKNSQEIPFSKEQIEQALGMCGLSLSVRGEALTLAQFAQLANAFTEIS